MTAHASATPPEPGAGPHPARTRVLVIDACNFIARYYYANPHVRETQIIAALARLREQHQPTHTVAATEAQTSWRELEFAQHKQNRSEKPERLRELFDCAPALMQRGGARLLRGALLEADDVIGCVARRHQGTTLISTNDKDLYSVLNTHTFILTPEGYFGPDQLLARYGTTTAQWPLYRAITGDSSDGHRGIPGLGPKAALRVLQRATTAQQALSWASQDSSKLAQTLLAHAEQLTLYARLATLRDADLEEYSAAHWTLPSDQPESAADNQTHPR